MIGRSPCPKAACPTVPASALTGALPVTLVLILCLMLAATMLPSVTTAQPAQTSQPGQAAAPAATAFRHTPPGPLHGAVGKELIIPVARDGSAEGNYTVQAILLSGPGKDLPNGGDGASGADAPNAPNAPNAADAADITVDGSTVRMVPRQPGAYVMEVRGMREGPIS